MSRSASIGGSDAAPVYATTKSLVSPSPRFAEGCFRARNKVYGRYIAKRLRTEACGPIPERATATASVTCVSIPSGGWASRCIDY